MGKLQRTPGCDGIILGTSRDDISAYQNTFLLVIHCRTFLSHVFGLANGGMAKIRLQILQQM